ncbi:MAG TPA: CinA family protein [Gammaproteobacteria bacterium]|nr:CinA family protein [Gammaproteobacteria bacterium]
MTISDQELDQLAEKLGNCLRQREMTLATAESCTGGWLGKVLTDVPGSSDWFAASLVTYSNAAKQALLGVNGHTLDEFGAVSGDTVLEMTDGLFDKLDVDVALSISGIAGPGGGTEEKPVGLVWISWGRKGKPVFAHFYHFEGDREAVRRQAVQQALLSLLDLLGCA